MLQSDPAKRHLGQRPALKFVAQGPI